MMVNDVAVTVDGLSDVTEAEIAQYIGYVEEQTNERVNELTLTPAAGTTPSAPRNTTA